MLLADSNLGDDFTLGVEYDCSADLCAGLSPIATESFSLLQEQLNRAADAIGVGSQIGIDGLIGDRTMALAAAVFNQHDAPQEIYTLFASNPTPAGLAANAVVFLAAAQEIGARGAIPAPPVRTSQPMPAATRTSTGGTNQATLWALLGGSVLLAGGALLAMNQEPAKKKKAPRGKARKRAKPTRHRVAARRKPSKAVRRAKRKPTRKARRR